MKKRLLTAIVLIIILVPAIYIGGFYFLTIGVLLSMIASFEMMNMFSTKSTVLNNYRYIIPLLSGFIVILIYLATIYGFNPIASNNFDIKNVLPIIWFIVVFVLILISIIGSFIFIKGSQAHDIMACIMTLCYCGLVMGFVISVNYLEPNISFIEHDIFLPWGTRSFGYLISIVVATDTFAYLVGSKFGKHKLCPEISPKKSTEGALGGLLAGGIIGTIVAYLLKVINLHNSLLILAVFIFSLIISVTVQIGDLVASKFKRSYDIKDYGKIFPGHGGVLDRFDSLIYAGAVYYLLMQLIQLIGM